MSSEGTGRPRRRRITEIKDALRELNNQLSLLNYHVGARVELKDVDLDCLDLVARHGPLTPSAIARRAGLHPATMTGILDRLERGAELFGLYAGMNSSLDRLLAVYGEAELELLADFLRRTTDAGRAATDELGTE